MDFTALDRDGYLILPGHMPPPLLEAVRDRVEELFAAEGDAAGSEFKHEEGARRLANCIDKGEPFRRCLVDPDVLDCVAHVLGPRFKLSSMNVRSANPRNGVSQPLHTDMGSVPDESGYWVCNTVWMLDDFTESNGALRAVPGTHRSGRRPADALDDLVASHPDEVLVTGRAGDVVVMNAHLWHGGTDNRTDRQRRALHGFFCRWDKPQQQYQKRLLRPETQSSLTARERALLALDDPLNDEVSSGEFVRSGFLK
jgi:hypothetical protein